MLIPRAIKYRDKYKYQLAESYAFESGLIPPEPIDTEFIILLADGLIDLRGGYAWDGPSGPAIDTPDGMTGSLIHDAFYQLMREGLLPREIYRDPVDKLLRFICIACGMSHARAELWYLAVSFFGDGNADPKHPRTILSAPAP